VEDGFVFALEVHMSEQDLEVLITLDDPGEDDLEEDTFHQADNTGAHDPLNRPATRPAKRSNCTATMIQIVSDRYHSAWVV
jgi:hypothetical protein